MGKQRARSAEDKEIKRRRLLDAARRLFSERGYPSTSIGSITEAAGAGTGTFYTYFSSKTEIFRTLYAEGIQLLHGMVEEAVSSPGMRALEKLSAVSNAYYRFYRRHGDYFEILSILHLGQRDFDEINDMVAYLDELATALLKTIERVISEGIETGEIRPMDPWKATCFLWGMMDGIMLLEERKNMRLIGMGVEDVITQGLEIVLQGMRPDRDGGL